jgi:hypothetical protein
MTAPADDCRTVASDQAKWSNNFSTRLESDAKSVIQTNPRDVLAETGTSREDARRTVRRRESIFTRCPGAGQRSCAPPMQSDSC